MRVPGKRIKLPRWVYSGSIAVRVDVEAVIPDFDPSEPCLETETMRWLDQLQQWANAGKIDELEKHGTVYVRKSA